MPVRKDNKSTLPKRTPKLVSDGKTPPPQPTTTTDERTLITYHISYTKNLGNFESMRIEAGLTLPAHFSDDMLDSAVDRMEVMRDKVAKRLMEDLDDLKP